MLWVCLSRVSVMPGRRELLFAIVLTSLPGCSKSEGDRPYRNQQAAQSYSKAEVKLFPIWQETKGVLNFFIRVNYFNEDWLFIEPGKTLLIRAGGEDFVLRSINGSLSDRKMHNGGYVSETADFRIEKMQMLKILSSENLTFTVVGVSENLERPLPDSTREEFQQFYDDYMR